MWKETENLLVNTYAFPDFKQALEFVNKVGQLAEKANHHPEIVLTWGLVTIRLQTHTANTVTDLDRTLARDIDLL